MIAPAPRKPMPVTICAAMRVGSARTTFALVSRNAWKPYAPTIVKSAEPRATSRCVRSPASRSRSSRSTPISPPSTAASASRSSDSSQFSVGSALDASCSNGLLLYGSELVDPGRSELEQLVETLTRERRPLRRRLYLHECTVTGHDDVHVHLGLGVFRVIEVEQRLAFDDPNGHCGHRAGQGLGQSEAVERTARRHVGAADRRTTRSTVRLQHVAVDPERPLAKSVEVRHGADRAADQPLDLDGASTLSAARCLPLGAIAGRRRQERVLRRQPAAALAVEPAWYAFLDRSSAQQLRLALCEEH